MFCFFDQRLSKFFRNFAAKINKFKNKYIMKTKLQLIILCLLLCLAGGESVIHAADLWSYPSNLFGVRR